MVPTGSEFSDFSKSGTVPRPEAKVATGSERVPTGSEFSDFLKTARGLGHRPK